MSIVASYLSLFAGSAEREAETAVATIRANLFQLSNLQGIGFTDASGKPIAIPNPDKRLADLNYLTFRSFVSAVVDDACAPNKTLLIKFLFSFPQTLVRSVLHAVQIIFLCVQNIFPFHPNNCFLPFNVCFPLFNLFSIYSIYFFPQFKHCFSSVPSALVSVQSISPVH